VSEERFDQIDRKLDAHDVRLDRIETDVATLIIGQSSVLNTVAELQAGQLLMKEELTRYMHVLHEDVIDRLKTIDQTDRLERLITATGNATRRRMDEALRPLHKTVKAHSVQIQKLQAARRSRRHKAS
jgi:hypothetical protein